MPFISSCLISLARTSGAVSNRGGESGRSYLVPDLSGEVSIFTTKYDVSYGAVFLDTFCQVKEVSFYS